MENRRQGNEIVSSHTKMGRQIHGAQDHTKKRVRSHTF